jgi:hypothetical protein
MKLGRGTAAFAVALLLGGCAWLEPPIDESELADPALGPAEELLRSVPGAGAPAYRFTIGGGGSCTRAEGVADIAGEAFQLAITMDGPEAGSSISMGFLVLGEETWIRLRLDPAGGGKAGGTCRIAFTEYGKAATPAAPVATDRSEEGRGEDLRNPE